MSSTATALDPSSPEAQPARPGAKATRKVLVKKVKQPAPIKKYIWLTGHGLTLGLGGIFAVFYVFRWWLSGFYYFPRICYRLAFIGVLMSYSITIRTTFGSSLPDYQTLFATENFQNFLLAIVWLVLRPSLFKLAPYYIVSLLQISSLYNVKIVTKYQTPLSDIIALSEIVVIFALLVDTLMFKGTSGFALAIYLSFYWIRLNFSPYTQVYILKLVHFIDTKIMSKQKPTIQAKWEKIKGFIEYRRSQTQEVIEKKLDAEPEPQPLSTDIPKTEKAIGKAQNIQLVGQEVPKVGTRDVETDGIKVPTDETSATGSKKAIAISAPETPQGANVENYKTGVKGAVSAAGADYTAEVKAAQDTSASPLKTLDPKANHQDL